METIAVYWEPVIRVYGFDIRAGVSLLEIDMEGEQAAYWADHIETFAQENSHCILAVLQFVEEDGFRICLVAEQKIVGILQQSLEQRCKNGYRITISCIQPVDVLFFHGPHFQDRFGIIDAVFSSLDHDSITIHTTGCTGTSVYLVTGPGQAESAKAMLSKSFVVP